ncbi:Hypothetical predicted protein, partial [Mytilus galloprovincialis]
PAVLKLPFIKAKLFCENAFGRLISFNESLSDKTENNTYYWLGTFRQPVYRHGVHTIVEIKENVTGIIGENGTQIKCEFTKEKIISTISVSFLAFNRSNIKFTDISTHIPNSISYLTDDGQYLKGRVTLMNITQSTTKVVLTFNKLMCIDDTFFQCKVSYFGSKGANYIYSNNASISVQVPPSKPDRLLIVHTPAKSSLTSTKNMAYSSSLPITSTSSNPLNDDLTSNIRYRTTTQQTTTEQRIVEGDNISIICSGDVGKPAAEYVFDKYLEGHLIPIQDAYISTSISELSENCSYYRTSNLTFKVKTEDNNAVIRCVVNSSMAELDMFVETEPIEVCDPVRIPTIINYPNKTDYIIGKDKSIHLTCKNDVGESTPSISGTGDNKAEEKYTYLLIEIGIAGGFLIFALIIAYICRRRAKRKRNGARNRNEQLSNRQKDEFEENRLVYLNPWS